MKTWSTLILSSLLAMACGNSNSQPAADGKPGVQFGVNAPATSPAPRQVRANTPHLRPTTASAMVFTAPAGWTRIEATQFRNPNFKLEKVEGGEAYVTFLPGGGGGVLPNANRWRSQIGLEALSDEDFQKLPEIQLAGTQGRLVDWTGSFKGMGDTEQKDFRLVGAIAALPEGLLTIKMTGPAAGLEGEVDNFKKFAASFKPGATGMQMAGAGELTSGAMANLPAGHPPIGGGMGEMPAGHPPIGVTPEMPAGHPPIGNLDPIAASAIPDANLAWTLPKGWTVGPQKPMRLATIQVVDAPEVDISIITLADTAGGQEANIERWFAQMGQPKPSGETIDKLPTIDVMGQKSKLVEVTGNFSGMGREAVGDAALLGIITPLPDQTLFIKITGPKDKVLAQKESLLAFAKSIKTK